MRTSNAVAATFAAALALSPMLANAQSTVPDPVKACSPTVAAALSTWDAGMAAAETFGEKAAALAREKGREYLLPLLGIDPKTAPPAATPNADPNAGRATDDVAREVEASRHDPQRRAELCAAITRAVNEARDTAGAGLEALKRAVDGLRLAPPPAVPTLPGTPAPTAPDGTIKT